MQLDAHALSVNKKALKTSVRTALLGKTHICSFYFGAHAAVKIAGGCILQLDLSAIYEYLSNKNDAVVRNKVTNHSLFTCKLS